MSEDFDPDAYLAGVDDFDPDAYLGEQAESKPKAPRKLPKVSRGVAALEALGQGAYSLGDELGAGLQGWSKFFGNLDKGPTEAMRLAEGVEKSALRENRELMDASREQHPGVYYPAMIAASLAMPGPKGAKGTKEAAKFAQRLGASMKAGAFQGAAHGFGASNSDSTGERLADSVLPAMAGAGAAGLLTTAAQPFRALGGLAKRSKEAQRLKELGVDNLTIGSLAPESTLGAAEVAVADTPGMIGTGIRAQRAAPLEKWRDAVVDAVRAPGAPKAAGETLGQKIDAAASGFDDAYAPIKSQPIPADMNGVSMRQAMSDVFRSVTDDEQVLAQQPTRDMVNKFLQAQATVLDRVRPTPWPSSPLMSPGASVAGPKALPQNGSMLGGLVPSPASPLAKSGLVFPPSPVIPPMRGSIPAASVLKVREGIRRAIREQLSKKDTDSAAKTILENAEEPLTDALNRYLPKDFAKTLQRADEQYSKLNVLESAARSAGDSPAGMQPLHLSNAVKAAQERRSYARGGGGELRELASLGRFVFEPRTKPTGARLLGAIPGVDKLAGGLAYAANTYPSVMRFALGETLPQRAAQRAGGLASQLRLDAAARNAAGILSADAFGADSRRRALAQLLSQEAQLGP